MKILSISTAEKECSIALFKDQRIVCEEMWATRQTHSKRIMDLISQVMDRASLSINELDGFLTAIGPGSFTGLRIGISTVKGLAYASSKPYAGISSLDGIAWQFSFSAMPVCIMMDAQRGEVYFAVYNFKNGKLVNKSIEKALSPVEAIKLLKEEILFAGSGAIAYREVIEKEIDRLDYNIIAHFAPIFLNTIKASALAHVLFQNPSLLNQETPVEPVYLRQSDAEINKIRH